MIKQWGLSAIALLAMQAVSGQAEAGSVSSGTIIGVFSNVITQGNYLNYPSLNQNTYVNNSATAVYTINNSSNTALAGTPPVQATGSSLQWGEYPPGYGVAAENSFSELTFFGAQTPADIHDPFQIGTITYLNGTSELSSQIFGANLSFYVNSVSSVNYLGTDQIFINTTNNFYQSTSQDADWINICGNNSNICNSRIEAVESYEGGTGVTANLTGDIIGDPQLIITSVSLPQGESSTTNGFIGTGGPQSIPEPASIGLFVAGLAGFAAKRRRIS